MECEIVVDDTMMFGIHPRYQCSSQYQVSCGFFYVIARLVVLWVGILAPDWICSNAGKILDASSEFYIGHSKGPLLLVLSIEAVDGPATYIATNVQ